MDYQAIGFANKFFTLWTISENIEQNNGYSYKHIYRHFVKNISFDKSKAIEKYPNAVFDESLKGHTRSWKTTKIVWETVDVFRFGKYKFQSISNSSDIDYISWYWNNCDEEQKEFIENILESEGYEIRTFKDGSKYLMSPQDLLEEKRMNSECKRFIDNISKNKQIIFTPESNVNDAGYYFDDNIIYHFPKVKSNYYMGYYYYLPMLNGKAKRIKFKTIIVEDFTYEVKDNKIYVEINKFDIMK